MNRFIVEDSGFIRYPLLRGCERGISGSSVQASRGVTLHAAEVDTEANR